MSSGGGFPNINTGYNSMGPKPSNYLVQSILLTLLCCPPPGIVAIVFACQVDGKWSAGDYQGAKNSSNQAKTWCWVSLGLWLALVVVQIFIMVAANKNGARF